MILPSTNPDALQEGEKFFINKNDVVRVLKELIDTYPADMIPQDVVKEALLKIVGSKSLDPLEGHPILKRLEETIAKAKLMQLP